MDKTSSFSNQYQSGLIDLTTGAPTYPTQASHSDDDLILASNKPKKRAGRTKFKETRHPVYRGVRSRNLDRWVCELREPINQTRIWLGTYPTAEMAARAHDVAALALRGPSACLNFADSVWCLPVPPSKEAKDIRKTAMEAAEAFRPSNSGKGGGGRINNVQVFYGASGSEEASMAGKMNTTLVSVCYNEEEGMEGMLNSTPENVFYHDEEAMLDMPGLMQDMAEGMMLSPPPSNGDLSSHYEDSVDTEFPLWSHSV